jgi:hypothetical protein
MKSKINISYKDNEVVIEGNKEGLEYLSEICNKLSHLSEESANTPANNFHISRNMNNAEEGSLPLIIILNPDL